MWFTNRIHLHVRLIVLLLLFVCWSSCSTVPDDPEVLRTRADQAVQEERYDDAKQYYAKLARKRPEDVKVLSELARLHLLTDESEEAIERLTQALEQQPEDPDLLRQRGTAYFKAGQPRKAVEDLTAALKKRPTQDALNVRGMAYVEMNQFKKAKRDFRVSINNRENVRAYLGLARVHMKEERWKQALDQLNQVLALDDKNRSAHLLRGTVYGKLDRPEKRKRDLLTYLELKNPDVSREKLEKQLDDLLKQ